MLDYIARFVLPAAFDVLPAPMASRQAAAFLLAIALQESKCAARRQGGQGPARGFWQFELGGVRAVLAHKASSASAQIALSALCYSPKLSAAEVRVAIEHNDVLACAFARLLLWTMPNKLPEREMHNTAWRQYLEAWRPGKPHPETWDANFERAWNVTALEMGVKE